MGFNPKDHYFKKAKKMNYAARSVFKLDEIEKRHQIFRGVKSVLDLGACPGSWSQLASQKVGPSGVVVGLDLSPVTVSLPNAKFFVKDILDVDLAEFLKAEGLPDEYDLVLSDMAPKTTGIKNTDQARSLELCEVALLACERHLRKGGGFVCKLFDGGGFSLFRKKLQKRFKKVDVLRPDSTRKSSKEVFFIAKDFLGTGDE